MRKMARTGAWLVGGIAAAVLLISPEPAEADEPTCTTTGPKQCEFTRPCIEWAGATCTKWGTGSWSYYPADS